VSTTIRLHPTALERLRARSGRTASSVLRDAGIEGDEFRARLAAQAFTPDHLTALARAMDCTPREIITASTFHLAKDRLKNSDRHSA